MSTSNLNDIANKIKNEHTASGARLQTKPLAGNVTKLGVVKRDVTPSPEIGIPEESDDNVLADFEREEDESVIVGEEKFEDDDDSVVIEDNVVPGTDFSSNPEEDSVLLGDSYSLTDSFDLTDETILESMPDIPENIAMNYIPDIRKKALEYRDTLMMKNALPAKDANTLALNKVNDLGDEYNIRYLKENPAMLNVTINKENEDKVTFTEEEQKKLTRSKIINLQVVEDVKIKTAKVKRIDKKNKASYLRKMDSNLAHYSVPLPFINDFVGFNGAQIARLIKTVRYDDMTVSELIAEKASLVYEKMVNGSHFRKTDENGNVVMSYTDFINKFMYYDLDMAIYGIVVASSLEETETLVSCKDCGQRFTWKYNVKQLLYTDDFTDEMKEKFDNILTNKSKGDYLKSIYEKENQSTIVESSLTHNQYYINQPSLARAISVFSYMDAQDEVMNVLARIALFIDEILVYDNDTEDYIQIPEEERENMVIALQMLPQEELDILESFVKPMRFQPQFVLKSVCKHCGQHIESGLLVDDLIFLRARDTSVATR